MEYKINQQALSQYTDTLTKKFIDNYFSAAVTQVNGAQILKFTKIELVDLFAIKILFEKWKKETDAIKSPYFNYQSEEVKEALAEFMAVLSRNILVHKDHFEPLLKEAISHSLSFILQPLEYIKSQILSPSKGIGNEELKDLQKYFKVHKSLVNGIFTQIQNVNPSMTRRLEIADRAYADFSSKADNAELLLQMFSDIVPIKLQDVTIDTTAIFEPEPEPEPEPEKVAPAPEKPAVQLELEDLGKPFSTQAEKDKKNKILDFKSALSINQRYMFVKELFQNKQDQFDEALAAVEQCTQYEQAINMLIEKYGEANNWDADKEEVAELFELISKKFF